MITEAENKDAMEFLKSLSEITQNYDLDKFKKLISSEEFSNFKLEKRVRYAFHNAFYSHKEEMLDYLIFEYCITSEEAINSISALMFNKDIAKKFEVRDLAKELLIHKTKTKKISKV